MSTPECRNDCRRPLRFPQRPSNRPGLSRISYRIGAYGDIREALLRHLNEGAVLSGWTHQSADDPGIALLEGAAILGDILTLYQEIYANEAYLPTATWRESVSDLVRLLGYRLAPGLGGRGDFAFSVSGSDPVTIPAGFPLTAQVTGLDGTADFETAADLVAYPWLSGFSLFRPQVTPPVTDATRELRIVSPDGIRLVAGDRLLVGVPYPDGSPTRLVGAEVAIVDSVRVQHGVSLVKLRGSLSGSGSHDRLACFKLGRSFRHFGHTTPGLKTVVTGGTASQATVGHDRSLSQPTSTDVSPSIAALEVPVEGKVDDLALGTAFVCRSVLEQSGSSSRSAVQLTPVRTITGVRQAAHTWGALTGPATVVQLDSALTTVTDPAVDAWASSAATYDGMDIREAELFETRSPLLTLSAAPADSPDSSGHAVSFYGTHAQLQTLQARSLLLAAPGADPVTATVQSVQSPAGSDPDDEILRSVTLDVTVDYADYPNDGATTVVYGNVATATQGKTQRQAAIGSGDARQAFQTFKLAKPPLTYLADSAQSPPEVPQLQVFVSDRLWTRVPALFGHGPGEEVYVVREDADNTSWVQFGDGITGALLPPGVDNVVAVWRTGQGAFGALKPQTAAQAAGRATGLDRVDLPGIVSGGELPETGDNARAAAPGKVQSLGRLVSIRDFETETLALAGVTLVRAAWELIDNVAAVVLTVLMDRGRDAEIATVRSSIAAANRCRGPQRFPVVVVQGSRSWVYLAVRAAVDPTFELPLVEAAIDAALGVDTTTGLFGSAGRTFSEPEYATRIEGTVQNVDGVLWAEVTALGTLGAADDPDTLAYPTAPALLPVAGCQPDEVLALHTVHLQHALTVPATEGCS